MTQKLRFWVRAVFFKVTNVDIDEEQLSAIIINIIIIIQKASVITYTVKHTWKT